jgi:hypothetical protein
MFENIEGVENLQNRLYWLTNRLNELRGLLNGFAQVGANLTAEGVTNTRQEFGFTQLEIILRNKQIADINNGFEMRSIATLLDQVPAGDRESRAWVESDQSVELRAAQQQVVHSKHTVVPYTR